MTRAKAAAAAKVTTESAPRAAGSVGRPRGRKDLVGRARRPQVDQARLAMLGKQLRTIRLERGIAATELAAAVDCDESTIYKIERGRSMPSFRLIAALVSALGLVLEVRICDPTVLTLQI